MLFTSGLRKAVDQYDPSSAAVNATADETSRILAEKRRRQMIRRHTCSTLKPPDPPVTLPPRVSFAPSQAILEEESDRSEQSSLPPPLPSSAPVPSLIPSRPPLDDWGTSSFQTPSTGPASVVPSLHSQTHPVHNGGHGSASQAADDFDDEWTDEDDNEEHRLSVNAMLPGSRPASRMRSGSRTDVSTDEEQTESLFERRRRRRSSSRENHELKDNGRGRLSRATTISTKESVVSGGPHHHDNRSAISRSQSTGDRAGSKINRNINRFSNFVKSGMEAYILGDSKMNGQPGEKHEILANGSMVQWKPIQQYYTCTVDKPKKETKLKGLKSFIAYSITSSLRGIQVSRRYKHFDWLHDQLSAKYIMIPIPPLPEKQVSGRYEEDLIDHRKHILQLWVNKICRHPVLSQSEVWLHFISATDERDWKTGKRKAEKDEYVGGNFLHCITTPTSHLDHTNVERQVEHFQKSVKTTEDSMRVMQERMLVFQKLFQGPVKSNWQKMALAFSTLGQSFQSDSHPGSNKMGDALRHTAHHYHNIGEEFDVHTRNDMEPVVENLYSFKGTVQGVPEILQVHKQAVQKLRENEGKVSQTDADRIRERVDSASYVVLAEMNHLNSEKIEDLRVTMGSYLKKQAEFYQKVANNLSELAQHYDF